MAYNETINSIIYNGYADTEGTNVEVTVKLSTGSDVECFWGVELKLPVGKINDSGELMITRTPENVIELIKIYLTKISKPFPLLLEKIKYLNLHFDGNWEETVINQHINPENEIYFCDHKHCHK